MLNLNLLMQREGYDEDEIVALLIASLKQAVEVLTKNPNIEIDTRGLAEEVLKAVPCCSNCDVIDALEVVKNVSIGWNMWTIQDVEERMEACDFPKDALSLERKQHILSAATNSAGTQDTFDDVADSLIYQETEASEPEEDDDDTGFGNEEPEFSPMEMGVIENE